MRVLHIFLYDKQGAGTTKVFLEYANNLEKYGEKWEGKVYNAVLASSPVAKLMEQEALSYFSLKYHPFFPFTLKKELRRLICSLGPQVILAHGRRAVRYSYSVLKALKSEFQKDPDSDPVSSRKNIAVNRFHRDFAKGFFPRPVLFGVIHSFKGLKVFKKADHVICVSKAIAEAFSKFTPPIKVNTLSTKPSPSLCKDFPEDIPSDLLFSKNIFVVPNTVSGAAVSTLDTYEPQIPMIGAMGRLRPIKGFDIWIQALGILKEKGYLFKACLGGHGDQLSHLKVLQKKYGLEKHLSFLGWVTPEKFFPKVDIFVIPSRKEPFGMVFLEAWSYGKAVIASGVDGLQEIGQDEENALMFSSENPQELADKIAMLLDYPSLKSFLAKEGMEALQKYTPQAVMPNLWKVFNSCV